MTLNNLIIEILNNRTIELLTNNLTIELLKNRKIIEVLESNQRIELQKNNLTIDFPNNRTKNEDLTHQMYRTSHKMNKKATKIQPQMLKFVCKLISHKLHKEILDP